MSTLDTMDNMFNQQGNEIHIARTASSVIDELKGLLKAAEKKLDEQQLALICAQDIVAAWPTVTLRTMGQMTNRIDTLRQALEAVKV
jgi:hypothetical protein